MEKLLKIMAALRDPDSGCPWDLQQDFQTIAPYTIEEAYEVADAIARKDFVGLKDELGDLLLQVVFHSQMAQEAGLFAFDDVIDAICEKMTRRHPHVFQQQNDDKDAKTPEAIAAIKKFWGQRATDSEKIEEIKQFWESEKKRERGDMSDNGVLDGIALALPALVRAQKLQKRAAHHGFDWPDIAGVLDKMQEEIAELQQAVAQGEPAEQRAELGDLLFTCVNLARWLLVDAEDSLREASRKFEKRFNSVEAKLKIQGKRWDECTLQELDTFWNQAKQEQ
jgi:uncharacterized protein YabN with tetrapyrrole methylase and pyrophosphatase domain